jgi:hypothetical protein
MNKWFLLALAFSTPFAQARDLTPILDVEAGTMGRIPLTESMDGTLVYVPALFSQKFYCKPDTLICDFFLWNQMTTDELNGIKQLRAEGVDTWNINPGDEGVRLSIQSERLETQVPQLQKGFNAPGTLTLDDEHAYGSLFFKPRDISTDRLTRLYENTGLGAYRVAYELKGVIRDFSIRIQKKNLVALLNHPDLQGALTFAQLKEAILSNLKQVDLKGYAFNDAAIIIAYQIKEKASVSSGNGLIKIDPSKSSSLVGAIKGRSWVIGESYQSAKQICSVELLIVKDGILSRKCEVQDE